MSVIDSGPIRLAVLDSDSGFVHVLVRRAEALGWQYRRLEGPPRMEEFIAMRIHALVVDPAVLGPGAWEFLERVAGALPGMGLIVATGRTSVAQRVRGLRLGADDWVTKPCHPEEVLARVEAVVRRRKRAAVRGDQQPLVEGEEPSPLQRVLTVADSGNGVSGALDYRRFLFINTDLSVHLHRMPEGEWVCLEARTFPEPNGVGLADTALYDERGRIGRAAQTLLVRAR